MANFKKIFTEKNYELLTKLNYFFCYFIVLSKNVYLISLL